MTDRDIPGQRRKGTPPGPTNYGHLTNRSVSTSRGGQPGKSMKKKKKGGCGPFILLVGGSMVAVSGVAAYNLASLIG